MGAFEAGVPSSRITDCTSQLFTLRETSITSSSDQLFRELSKRYRIEREIGRGGMATVYLAEDLKHHRQVAIKVLDPELASVLGPERFLQEIELTANLQHPHILPLFDSGAVEGMLYYVMPFVHGESLAARLAREKVLPVSDAVRIAAEVASALDYAHRRGLIHRDIKPDNILLHEGQALVADFGIALAVSPATRATATGVSLGTPAYMSPEQAMAERNLTPQSDIYALGVVTYEMLAGETPFSGPSAPAIIARVMTERPRSLRGQRPVVSQALESAVFRALEKVPADRFATASDFASAIARAADAAAEPLTRRRFPLAMSGRLRGILFAFAGLILVSLAVWRFAPSGNDKSIQHTPAATMLAVLPFENLGRPENAYFADGMSEEIRGKLARLPGLMVIARTSSMEYKDTKKPPQQIARELGVQYLLAATIRTEQAANGKPGRVRVSPELVQLVNGAPIARWQQGFDADMTDVFQVQADIAERVAQALDIALAAGDSSRLVSRPTQNLAAYDAYLQGEEASNALGAADIPSLQRAVRFYERAVALDTTFSQAFARLSRAQTILYLNGLSGGATVNGWLPPLRAAEKAIALAPDRPDGRLALAMYYGEMARDQGRALDQVRLALAPAPNNPETIAVAAYVARNAGRWTEALSYARRAETLDPRSLVAEQTLGEILLWFRSYDDARGALDRALSLAPHDLGALEDRVMLDLARGDLQAARNLLGKAQKADPAALAAFFAQALDLGWVLDDAHQRLLLTLSAEAFGGNRAAWGSSLSQVYALRGNQRLARAYADSGRVAIEAAIRADTTHGELRVYHALLLAYLGDFRQAELEGQRAVALTPMSRQAQVGTYVRHQLARVYILIGQPDKALDQLEPLLRMPYFLSPGWLRIDPTFAPLRGNPRFERLLKP